MLTITYTLMYLLNKTATYIFASFIFIIVLIFIALSTSYIHLAQLNEKHMIDLLLNNYLHANTSYIKVKFGTVLKWYGYNVSNSCRWNLIHENCVGAATV